ncbi:MAG TPA: hypothetical protein VKB72_07630 [Steroidobacteraceae bacterium]|nr:hypothetical protein [Steroidobacteraceae bacterium]
MKIPGPGRCALLMSTVGGLALALPPGSVADTAPAPAAAARDGQHDFDFDIGVWRTHIRRTLDPLSGATHSIELNGTVTVRKVWDGRAELEEIETDGPKGHWEGLTLFLYNPAAHQWSMNFVNSKVGQLNTPLVGSFTNGRGELFGQDTLDGRAILVRGVWSNIEPDSHQYEESYSADGGKTWARAFVANLTREKQ